MIYTHVLNRAAGEYRNLASKAPACHLPDLDTLYRKAWVVYCKPPFGSPEQVLAYLARYTHRIAITNSRLVRLEDEQVTFTWKDYADHDASGR
jgi:hypothetical protein